MPPWGTSTPAIWKDAIFVTTHTDEGKLLLLRINKTDGVIVWTPPKRGMNSNNVCAPELHFISGKWFIRLE